EPIWEEIQQPKIGNATRKKTIPNIVEGKNVRLSAAHDFRFVGEKEMIGNIRKAIVAIAIAAAMIVPVVNRSSAATSPVPIPAPFDADLSAEGRLLDTYVAELVQFDKKG